MLSDQLDPIPFSDTSSIPDPNDILSSGLMRENELEDLKAETNPEQSK